VLFGVGRVKGNWETSITVSTFGTKTVSATIQGRRAEVRINFEPGSVHYIRCGLSSRIIHTGKYRTYTNSKTGKTTTSEITETEYTPTLQLVNINVGESEYDVIKGRKEKKENRRRR